MDQNSNDDCGKATGISSQDDGKKHYLKTDEAIKLLFSSEKQALIRFINSALGESFDPETTELVESKTEFIHRKAATDELNMEPAGLERITADMIFTLNGAVYHIEFQTKADQAIAIRIIGYGVEHALSVMRNSDDADVLVFEFPVPVLIQIDKNERLADKIPAQIKISGRDDTLDFDITVIKLWTYDVKSLVNREFYLLLPFLLMRHRKKPKSDEDVQALLTDLKTLSRPSPSSTPTGRSCQISGQTYTRSLTVL